MILMAAVVLERVVNSHTEQVNHWKELEEELDLEEVAPGVYLANTLDGRRMVTLSVNYFNLVGVGYHREQDNKLIWIQTPFINEKTLAQINNARRLYGWEDPQEMLRYFVSSHAFLKILPV